MANIIRMGGGSVKLTGDATAADVKSGKTFYSDDPKTKLTGTSTAVRWAEVEVTWTKGTGSTTAPFSTTVTGLNFTPAYFAANDLAGSSDGNVIAGGFTLDAEVGYSEYRNTKITLTAVTNNGDGTLALTLKTVSNAVLPTTLRLYES